MKSEVYWIRTENTVFDLEISQFAMKSVTDESRMLWRLSDSVQRLWDQKDRIDAIPNNFYFSDRKSVV